MIIAVEGIDGAGKNTTVIAVKNVLESAGKTVGTVAFPAYGSYHADMAEKMLQGENTYVKHSPEAMATLFALDRHNQKEQLVAGAIHNDILIIDRYVASNVAYTTARTRGDIRKIAREHYHLEHDLLGMPVPDLYIFLDTGVTISRQRALTRAENTTRVMDSYELDDSLQVRATHNYRELAELSFSCPWLVVPGGMDTGEIVDMICCRVGDSPSW